MTPEQKSTFFRKSPDLVERINFCYESTDPINAFQSLVTSLADQYQRQFSFLPEDVINNCKEKVLALIEKMKPHLPTEITLINQEASHEDARQEAVQTQEQVKEQQAENEQEAERACYDSPSPYRPCSILNPESIQKLLKCFPQTLNVSHNYRHTTTYGFSKATLAPVLYVLKANDQWIIITETDKHFYDRGSLSLGSIEYNQTELIDLLALQKDHTALAALNDEDSCHFVYTLLLSGHFRQLQQYLTMPQLKNITTFLTKLQYHEASRELFRELISIHPQHQSHINQLNHTDFASLKAENENKSRILKTFFETTALKKLKRIKESRAKILRWVKKLRDKRKKTSFTPSLMPKYKPANQAELQAAIKRAQGQHSYQYILSLLVFLFTFISVHLSSILWLKLSILVATFNMMNHLFTLNTLKIDMNRRPSLKPYIFLNAYGCSEIDKRQSLKMIKQLETILICITPLSMIYFLYGTPLSMMLVALCAIQFMLNGLKSMMSSQYLSQRLFDHSPVTKSVPQRIKLTLSKHISKGLIRSLPSLSKIKDQSDRLRIALSILSYVHKNHLILSNVPKDYFDELLQFTRSTDSKNYQSFCRLVQYHNVYQPAIQSESLKTGIYQAEALNDKSVEEEKDSLQLKV
jgi:hypothetical protein